MTEQACVAGTVAGKRPCLCNLTLRARPRRSESVTFDRLSDRHVVGVSQSQGGDRSLEDGDEDPDDGSVSQGGCDVGDVAGPYSLTYDFSLCRSAVAGNNQILKFVPPDGPCPRFEVMVPVTLTGEQFSTESPRSPNLVLVSRGGPWGAMGAIVFSA